MMRLLIGFALLLASSAARGDAPADLDRDGDVDLADFSLLQRCFSGSGVPQPAQDCQVSRITPDAAVDLDDFVAWANCLDGPGAAAPPSCTPQGTQYFPRSSVWYQDISFYPEDPQSAAVIQWLSNAGGWGLGRMQIDFSLEVLQADANTPLLSFTATEDWFYPDCDIAAVPVPAGGALEGETGYACESDGDCHLIAVYPPAMKLYEMWRANIVDGSFYGGCLAVWDMTREYAPSGRGENCTSADAAGYPIAPLLFNADEVQAGWIDHAIRFILPNSRIRHGVYLHPATHSTGATSGGSMAPPYGARLRLRADYPIDTLPSAGARVVARAMQRYGIMLADGGSVALTAQSDRFTSAKWAGLLDSHDLVAIQVSDFVMVDGGARIPYSGDCVREPLVAQSERAALSEAPQLRALPQDPPSAPLQASTSDP
jgi:serine/threonine-protein kinase